MTDESSLNGRTGRSGARVFSMPSIAPDADDAENAEATEHAAADGAGSRHGINVGDGLRTLGERPLHVFVNVAESDAAKSAGDNCTEGKPSTLRRRTMSQPIRFGRGASLWLGDEDSLDGRDTDSDTTVAHRSLHEQACWCWSYCPFRGISEDISRYIGDDEQYIFKDGPESERSLKTSSRFRGHTMSTSRKLLTRWCRDWTCVAKYPDLAVEEDSDDEMFGGAQGGEGDDPAPRNVVVTVESYPGLIIRIALYIFVNSLISALTMGQLYKTGTEDHLGFLETVVGAAIAGLLQSVIGGNPHIIMGNTGPVVVLYVLIYQTAVDFEIPFFGWLGFTNMWAAVFLIAMSITNASDFVAKFTRFTGEILEIVISIDLIASAVQGTVREFHAGHREQKEYSWFVVNGLMSMIFTLSFFVMAKWLYRSREWTTLWYGARTSISRFGPMIALVLHTVLSYLPQWAGDVPSSIPRRIDVASSWGVPGSLKAHWLNWNHMATCTPGAAFGAIIPGACVAALLYVDHNMTSKMATEGYGLRVKSMLHYDLFLLGINVLVCGLIGIPPSSAAVPINPAHTRALVKRRIVSRKNSLEGDITPRYQQVVIEQRFTNTIQSLLLFLCIFVMPIFGFIPSSLMWGHMLVLGTISLNEGSEFFLRSKLMISSRSTRNMCKAAFLGICSFPTIAVFTAIQIAVCLLIVGFQVMQMVTDVAWMNVATVLYPAVILLMPALRSFVLPCLFSRTDLEVLDDAYTTERVPPKRNRRTKLNEFTEAHKGGVPIKRRMRREEMDSLVRRRESEVKSKVTST